MGDAPGLARAWCFDDLPQDGLEAWNRFSPPALTPSLDLPCDRARAHGGEAVLACVERPLDATFVAALSGLGAAAACDLRVVVLAGFATLLRRLSRQDELVLLVACNALSRDGVRQPAAVRVRLAARRGETFMQVLADTGRALRDAAAGCRRPDAAAGTLPDVGAIVVPRACQALFGFDADCTADSRTALGGPLPELGLRVIEGAEGGLRLACDHDIRLFDGTTAARWLEMLETLMRSAVDNPRQAWDAMDWVSAAERRSLAALQPQRVDRGDDRLVHDRIAAQARESPAHIAVASGNHALDHASLDRAANAIAHALRDRGIGRGDFVGMCVERGPMLYATVLGILKAGGAFVPLDPEYPDARLRFMVEDAGLRLLVCSQALAEACRCPSTLVLEHDMDDAAWARDRPPSPGARDADHDSPAYVIYTSGSTGKPKGVVVPHRALTNLLHAMQRVPGFGADDRMVAVTVSSFDMSIPELFLPLVAGGQVVVASRDAQRDGHGLRRLLEASGATCMQATPSGWRLLLATGWQGGPRFRALVGGESLPPDLAATLAGCCGEVWNMYGPTETTVWSTCARIASPVEAVTIGRPLDNTSVWVLDGRGRPCPVGVPGELWIGGDGVALGYHRRPRLTAERFIPDPFDARPGARLYRTGDFGRWRADGNLEHLGRLDSQVKLRGYRIELGEIEASLAGCEGVSACVATVREDRPGDARLVAYVVPGPGPEPSIRALRHILRSRLPGYMVPQHVVLVDALPLSPNGKVDRKALPAPGRGDGTDRRVAPRGALQARIVEVVARTLGLPGFAIDEDLRALCGTPEQLAAIAAGLEREFGRPLPLRTLLQENTVVGLVSHFTDALARAPSEAHIDKEPCMTNPAADGQQPDDPRESYLIGVWSDILGLDVGPDDNFFDAGGNSMLAVRMSERVARETGYRIKLMQLAAQSVGEIAAHLPSVPSASTDGDTRSGLLRGVKRLFGRQATMG